MSANDGGRRRMGDLVWFVGVGECWETGMAELVGAVSS